MVSLGETTATVLVTSVNVYQLQLLWAAPVIRAVLLDELKIKKLCYFTLGREVVTLN
ncbi:hypothetical protein [Sulfolobus tengchongensis spindle-shaped virus 3]|nr:hypothetical protein [Sulfolobus tengchongensis spindle-shaped virus 3]